MRGFPLRPDDSSQLGLFRIVAEDDPGLDRREDLGGVEARDADVSERAQGPTPKRAAETRRRVLDQRQAELSGGRTKGLPVRGATAIVEHDGGACLTRRLSLELYRIQIQCLGLDVGEDRRGSLVEDGVGRRDVRERGDDDFVSRPHADQLESDVKRRRSRIDGHAIGTRRQRRNHLFELANAAPLAHPARLRRLQK